MIGWHRLFGLALTDLFTGTGFEVELEKDLSLKKQLLDCLVVERHFVASLPELPDGLEDLDAHNLVTFKSHHEPLEDFSLDELLGHFVNLRKQLSPGFGPLLPVERFRLLAVCARFPDKLAGQAALSPVKPGVLEVRWGVRPVRIIVLREVAREPRNALWELFSAEEARVREGAARYRWKRSDLSTVLRGVYEQYGLEGLDMPYTVEDYKRELAEQVVRSTPPEELLKWIPVDEMLERLPPEEMLKRLSREQILDYLKKLDQQS